MDDTKKWIWKPVEFNSLWKEANTEKFDNLLPAWRRRREELEKDPENYKQFMDQLKREQAIDTGILERMYDLSKGVTETFIKEGFLASNLQHGETNIPQELLMDYLTDNFDAIDFIFDFVKNNRELSTSYIKELHALITRHQDTIAAINPLGQYGEVELLKGEYKKRPNNPKREGEYKKRPNNPKRDGIIYYYCPPEQTASEMDNLISIFNTELRNAHIIIKAAFLHHAFVQIHPFQDGNGRLARLLASFVLIKEGLFPLAIDRNERTNYINALEKADEYQFQDIVDIISDNQIKSIQQSLNWETVDRKKGYINVLDILGNKLSSLEKEKQAEIERNARIKQNMELIYGALMEQLGNYINDLQDRFKSIEVSVERFDEEFNDFLYLIFPYAKFYNYFVNYNLDSYFIRMNFKIKDKRYWLLISLHHYGHDNSTFAIGATLLQNEWAKKDASSHEVIPIKIPPLTMSSEKELSALKGSIHNHLEDVITTALAIIASTI
jgi:fido (protein-threonine AMPylation protein)